MLPKSASVLLPLLLVACAASTPGAQPHEMSAAQHDAHAADEDRAAAQHGAQADGGTLVSRDRCEPFGSADVSACWTTARYPNAEHLEETRRHQQMAADHRAASQALRDAEGKACVGLADTDRDISPFMHRDDIVSVAPLSQAVASSRTHETRIVGATIVFRPVAGMSAPWLQRVVDCHLARNASLGHNVPEMPYCPLVPNGVAARVTAVSTGFAIEVRSDDPTTAQEILRRAQSLTPPSRNAP